MDDLVIAQAAAVPALSATSDMPTVTEAPAPEVVEAAVETPKADELPKADDTPVSEPVSEPDTNVADAKAKTSRGVQKRLDELTAQRIAAENVAAEAQAANKRLMDLLEKRLAPEPPKEPELQRPKRSEFEDPDAYDEALVNYAAAKGAREAEAKLTAKQAEAQAEAERKANEDAAKRETQTIQTSLTERREKALQKYEDFADVAENHDVKISTAMATAIIDAGDIGIDVQYHLGKNPEMAEKIAAMTPTKAAIEIGKLAVQLEAEAEPVVRPAQSRKVTAAPEPVAKSKTAKAAATGPNPETESGDEYYARRCAELGRKAIR